MASGQSKQAEDPIELIIIIRARKEWGGEIELDCYTG